MKKYTYYIAYTHPKGTGYSNLISEHSAIDLKILSEFVEDIKKFTKLDNIIIINIIPLPLTHSDSLEVTE